MDSPILNSVAPPGSSNNPFVLPDTPPKKRKKRKREDLDSATQSGSEANSRTAPDTAPAPKAKPKRIIFGGPPSAITRDASMARRIRFLGNNNGPSTADPSRHENGPPVAGPSRLGSLSRPRTQEAPARPRAILALEASLPRHRPYLSGGARSAVAPRLPTPGTLEALGWRPKRHERLTHRDLWVDGRGPTTQEALQDHHKCGICQFVKSHPVSYICGHSHCYVCIRLWLEEDFSCPDCKARIYQAPFRHWGEEKALACDYARDYPLWQDDSVVDYSWGSLVFPKQFV
ncbi:hypothetical protein C8F04DRAFT_1265443 [Mycena alexandri]|uniref:RING-type domain-containing protein n=1 Tax=Mycena alexandri TaxID=1745969 RepID=A0AAD6SKE6_9AGAR|nr:hypothetical protein C8F04DRAFT_1265443 [Mycena alexandri]